MATVNNNFRVHLKKIDPFVKFRLNQNKIRSSNVISKNDQKYIHRYLLRLKNESIDQGEYEMFVRDDL